MSSIGSACLEDANSTDCLFRALLKFLEDQAGDEAAKYNWDPLTFGFTVPIGILAATFALVTIYLAVVATGAGRRKSGASAIGRWSERTRRKWDWQGLMWATTAETPVLTTSNVSKILKSEMVSGEDVSNLTASWPRFLYKVGIGYAGLGTDKKALKATAADYLPGDVLAVPAYGEVGFIITAAACMGAHSFRSNPNAPHPVIVGEGFQFDFRHHPTLGTVGAFSVYDGHSQLTDEPTPPSDKPSRAEDSTPRPFDGNLLRFAIQHAKGEVEACETFFERGKVERDVISAIDRASPEKLLRSVHGTCDSSRKLCSRQELYSRHDDHHLLWLLIGKTPGDLPAIFPTTASCERSLLSALALNSKVWATARPEGDDERLRGLLLPAMSWPPEGNLPPNPTDKYRKEVLKALGDMTELEKGSGAVMPPKEDQKSAPPMLGVSCVLRASLRLLGSYEEFQAWFNALTFVRRRLFRDLVLFQLRQLDAWLKGEDSEEEDHRRMVRCRATTLFLTTTTFLDIEWASTKAAGGPASRDTPRTAGGLDPRDPPRSPPVRRETKLGAHTSHTPDPPPVQREPKPSAHAGPRSNPLARHAQLLSVLDELVHSLPPMHRGEKQQRDSDVWNRLHLSNYGLDPTEYVKWASSVDLPNQQVGPAALLDVLRPVVSDCYRVAKEGCLGKCVSEGLKDMPDLPSGRNGKANQQAIDRVLIWRCLVMAMLFWTAPDNSEILLSGLWQHIVPMI